MSIIHDALKKAEKDRHDESNKRKLSSIPSSVKKDNLLLNKKIQVIAISSIAFIVLLTFAIFFIANQSKDEEKQLASSKIMQDENTTRKVDIDTSNETSQKIDIPVNEQKKSNNFEGNKSILIETPSHKEKKSTEDIPLKKAGEDLDYKKRFEEKIDSSDISYTRSRKRNFEKSKPEAVKKDVGTSKKIESKIPSKSERTPPVSFKDSKIIKKEIEKEPVIPKKPEKESKIIEPSPKKEIKQEPPVKLEKKETAPQTSSKKTEIKSVIRDKSADFKETDEKNEQRDYTEKSVGNEKTRVEKLPVKSIKKEPSPKSEVVIERTPEKTTPIKKDEQVIYSTGDVKEEDSSGRYYNKGVLFERDGQFQEAMWNYKKAIELDPKNAGAHNGLGNLYLRIRELDKAKKEFQLVLMLDPTDAKARNNLGLVYLNMNEYIKAASEFIKAIDISPTNVAAYNNLGITYKKLKQFKEALDYFEKAVFIDNEYAEAYYGRATVLESLGRVQEAILDYKKFIQYAPASLKNQVRKVQDHIMDLYEASANRY